MAVQTMTLTGPDFSKGFPLQMIKDGSMLLGQAHGEPVILIRRGEHAYAVSAFCTHYGAPLIDGIVTGDRVRCPWHHACFSIKSGSPLSAPALNGLTVWNTRIEGERVFVTDKKTPHSPSVRLADPRTFVIVGGGAAGLVAAETLRDEGFLGKLVLFSRDSSAPYDRPNLSKDYLAGKAPEEWIPLRPADFYVDRAIDIRLGTHVTQLDPSLQQLTLASGAKLAFDALLLATGASPLQLAIPGGELPHVRYLRTLENTRALIEKARSSKRAVIIGASFIGLEVAAALRSRGLEVDVVGKEAVPFERTLGPELGSCVRQLHEENGVRFHLERSPARIHDDRVELSNGAAISADLVVVGVGVKPETALAEQSGLIVDRGIQVNEFLAAPGHPSIFAAGDVARYPDPITGENIRIEHWVLAQRMAKVAALNMLGRKVRFAEVPFFWSNHYDLTIGFTGVALPGAKREVIGSIQKRNCLITYSSDKRITGIATIGRDKVSLLAEAAFEKSDFQELKRLVSRSTFSA
jgi:apoptosis-inducing factor 3